MTSTPNICHEAERAVIGGCLKWPDDLPEVLQILSADDFYCDAHQRTFRALADLFASGVKATLHIVADLLKKRGEIEDIGGYSYLADIWEGAPSAVVAHAKLVRERSILRRLERAAIQIAEEAKNPTGPAEQVLEDAERRIFEIAALGAQDATASMAECVNEAIDRLDARLSGGRAGAVRTGFLDLDRLLDGLHNGELIVLAARPSQGKTSLALNIAENVARDGVPVLFVSLEQLKDELTDRLVCSRSKVDSQNFRAGRLSTAELEGLTNCFHAVRELPLWIDDCPHQGMVRIMANARRLMSRKRIGLVVIDYLQLIDAEDRRAHRQEQVAAISRRLKHMARELKIPVLALSQFNREIEKERRRPRLSDLRESGAIEQDADVVILLHAVEDEQEDGMPRAEVVPVEVIVAKHRNGPTGIRTLGFRRRFMRFENFRPEVPHAQEVA